MGEFFHFSRSPKSKSNSGDLNYQIRFFIDYLIPVPFS